MTPVGLAGVGGVAVAVVEQEPDGGVDDPVDHQLQPRVVDRLATMETESGGLSYWPGETEPNTYGTVYAM